MLSEFKCPDGQRILKADCLEKCRMNCRCLTKTMLSTIEDRPWDGQIHVTQALQGTMQSYLMIKYPYAVEPRDRIFAMLGISHHRLMADNTQGIAEIHLSNGWLQGTADLLEVDGGEWILTDSKTWGSYRVVRALGMVKSGKGFSINPDKADLENETLQLNAYRWMLSTQGNQIDRMQLSVAVRDGGIQAAVMRGIKETNYLIPIPMIADEEVERFFRDRYEKLSGALEGRIAPAWCSSSETWQGNKCEKYCGVRDICPQYRGIG